MQCSQRPFSFLGVVDTTATSNGTSVKLKTSTYLESRKHTSLLLWEALPMCLGTIHWDCRAAQGQLQPCPGFVSYYILVPRMEAQAGEGEQVPQMAGSGASCPRCGHCCWHPPYASPGKAKHLRVRSSQHPEQLNKYLIQVTRSVKGYLKPCLNCSKAPPIEDMAVINVLEKVPTTPRPLSQQGRHWSTIPSDLSTHMNLKLPKVPWKLSHQTVTASVCKSLSTQPQIAELTYK